MREERRLSPVEESERQMRVAITSRPHLREWLEKSGRQWLVFNSAHLVDALPFPDGVEAFIQFVACYRDHRATLDTGETAWVENPKTGTMDEVPLFHSETLTLVEMDRAIRWMVGQITAMDPDWKLTNPPL
jgi:hypothetical protein